MNDKLFEDIDRNLERLRSGKCKPKLETIYEHPEHYMIVTTCCNHPDCVVKKKIT